MASPGRDQGMKMSELLQFKNCCLNYLDNNDNYKKFNDTEDTV